MNRHMPSSRILELAAALVACELSAAVHLGTDTPTVFRVVEKLAEALRKLAGAAGLRSLILRSLALAKERMPGLDILGVGSNGSLEGVPGLQCEGQEEEGGMIVLTQLLGLLVIFIGEDVTISLLRGLWPAFEDEKRGEQLI